jgi:peptide/nickel transport system permease protein
MSRYFLRRSIEGLVTLIGVAVLVFIVMRVLPGDEITARQGIEAGALTPTQRQALERYYGLDRPLVAQFFSGCAACSREISACRSPVAARFAR